MKRIIVIILIVSLCLTSFLYSAYGGKRVKLNKTKATIRVGKTLKLKVKNTHKKIKWKTSNKKIATVSKKGKVKGKKVGRTTITAKVGKKKYKCKVSVIKKKPNVKPQETTTPEVVNPNDWYYEYAENGTVVISGYKGQKTAVTIPEKINGCSVTRLKTVLDKYNNNTRYNRLREIVIPDSVVSIDEGTFRDCGLEKVVLPSFLEEIPDNLFYKCDYLTDIKMPNYVKRIGRSAFALCKILKSVNIPYGVEIIDVNAFGECYELSNLTIPESVSVIGKQCFFRCEKLERLLIPNSVTDIGESAFWLCFNLREVTISNRVTKLTGYTFGSCSNITVTIPSSVTSMHDEHAFLLCSSVTIRGEKGSYAEKYAKTHNFNFEAIQ